MKWYFNLIFFLLLCPQSLLSKDFHVEYLVKTKGIVIGALVWDLEVTENYYKTSVELKDKGVLSVIYEFVGNYSAFGKIQNKVLVPLEYNQSWKTKKKQRDVKIIFKDNKIDKLNLVPLETESPRFNFKNLTGYNDPLTSFINILLNKAQSYTIDGRRTYLLSNNTIKKHNQILIKEYKNIWADHKKIDLEYLEIFQNKEALLPKKIIIKFKGSIFSLNKI